MEKIIQIPNKSHQSWKKLIQGKIEVSFVNFFLQKKVTQLIDLYSREIISLDKGINELHTLCIKFCNASGMHEDLIQIFGEETIKVTEVETLKSKVVNKKKTITKLELKNLITEKEAEIEQNKIEIERLQEENALLLKKYETVRKGLETLKNLKPNNNPKKTSSKVKPFFFF